MNILLIIFNKEEETKRVFSEIQNTKPDKLFIAADGPRAGYHEEEKCISIRNWVLEQIDWECEVKTLFRQTNVGCGRGPSEAITWFFNYVTEGIILEDDCLPCKSFFTFAAELLEKYRHNPKISIISGNNFQKIQPMNIEADYYYSIFPSSNGWATWKRSWDGFDYSISSWPGINKKKFLSFLFKEKQYRLWWKNQYDMIYNYKPDDMWDFQFHYHCMARQQYAIIPKANLVTNIGYGPNATHSKDPHNYFANVPTFELNTPLRHPRQIIRNQEADIFIQTMLFGNIETVSPYKKIKRYIKKLIQSSRT